MDPAKATEAILAANRQYVEGHPARAELEGHCLIAACMSTKLNRHLPAALGIDPDRCYVVRNAGATVTATDNSILRSAALAAAVGNVQTVIVLGHDPCSAAWNVMELSGRLEKRGVPRSALPDDLRSWLGLIGPSEANVRAVVDALASHPALPEDVAMLGMMIDNENGRLTAVCAEASRAAKPAVAPQTLGPLDMGTLGPIAWDRSDIGSTAPPSGLSRPTETAAANVRADQPLPAGPGREKVVAELLDNLRDTGRDSRSGPVPPTPPTTPRKAKPSVKPPSVKRPAGGIVDRLAEAARKAREQAQAAEARRKRGQS